MSQEQARQAKRLPSDLAARVFGLIIFTVGILGLIIVFTVTYHFFSNLSPDQLIPALNPKGIDQTFWGKLIGKMLWAALKVGLLFVMAYTASLIAARGAQLYAAGRTGPVEME